MYNPNVLKVNNGYILVGSVPMQLCYVSQDDKTLEDSFIVAQLRLPAKYRSMKTRVFGTEIKDLNALKECYENR